jgi:hypothetical protein
MDHYATVTEPGPLEGMRPFYRVADLGLWWLPLLLAVPLIAGGAWLGLRAEPHQLGDLHRLLPELVAALASGATLLGGGIAWAAFHQRARLQRREALARANPGRPGLADHHWTVEGVTDPRWRGIGEMVLGALIASGMVGGGLALLVLDLPQRASGDARWFAVVIAAVGLTMLALIGYRIGRARKFVGARLQYQRYPYRVGEPLDLVWWPPVGHWRIARGTIVLRCLKQRLVRAGKHTRIDSTALWQGTWSYQQARELPGGIPVGLRFEPPAGLPPTDLTATEPIAWELEVRLEMAGIDLAERYLVPVY